MTQRQPKRKLREWWIVDDRYGASVACESKVEADVRRANIQSGRDDAQFKPPRILHVREVSKVKRPIAGKRGASS